MTYGLIGAKLGHSYSKIIHEMLGHYEYELLSLSEAEFEEFIRARNFKGLNITIPYKKDVIPLCDEVAELASEIGAVNTLYFKDDKLCGTNTDYQGFLYAADSAGIDFKGRKVLILGNGGTSLTARKAVKDRNASEILITTRRGEAGCVSYDNLKDHRDVEIIINTTPVGTYPNNGGRLIDLKDFPKCCGVIDVIYNPFATDLLLQAKELGIPHSNGLPMLVAQATAAAEYFLGVAEVAETDKAAVPLQNNVNKTDSAIVAEPDKAVVPLQTNRGDGSNMILQDSTKTPANSPMHGFQQENPRIIAMLEKEIENIVLIGMPGCGKSTLGKGIAEKCGKTFVDMDSEIEKLAEMKIPDIFEQFGEERFRDYETQVAKNLGKEKGLVIATGGGVILKPENMDALRQNGRVVFIERPLEELATDGRPLSKDLETLKKMYETRFPLYNKYGKIKFTVEKSISENVEDIVAKLGY